MLGTPMTVGVASAPHRLHPGVTRLAWAAPLRALLRPPIPSCCPLPPTTVPVLGLLPPRLLCPPLLLPLPPPAGREGYQTLLNTDLKLEQASGCWASVWSGGMCPLAWQ